MTAAASIFPIRVSRILLAWSVCVSARDSSMVKSTSIRRRAEGQASKYGFRLGDLQVEPREFSRASSSFSLSSQGFRVAVDNVGAFGHHGRGNTSARPRRPEGGEATGMRALYAYIRNRYA